MDSKRQLSEGDFTVLKELLTTQNFDEYLQDILGREWDEFPPSLTDLWKAGFITGSVNDPEKWHEGETVWTTLKGAVLLSQRSRI